MTKLLKASLLCFLFLGCKKNLPDCFPDYPDCDIEQVHRFNATKPTLTAGIWGTVSEMKGDCMPMAPPASSRCTNCPVNRTVRIYEYTHISQATPSGSSSVFFDHFSTQLLSEVVTDDLGFFQISLVPGTYTVVVVENGKLYAGGRDGNNGLSPVVFSGGVQNINLVMSYKAAF